MAESTRESVITQARELASRLGKDSLTRQEFFRETGLTAHHIQKLFPDDGWRGVLEGAGLSVTFQNEPTPDETLLDDFHRVVSEMKQIPTGAQYDARGEYSFAVFKKRFGGIQGTLKRYRTWLDEYHPDAPERQLIPIKSKHEVVTTAPITKVTQGGQQWTKTSSVVFGAPINFRGLRHAPINEQGVVYLFGMVSEELGLIVEAIQSAYPDCEAKRCIDTKHDQWQRVLIEFEFRSSNFREHGHDPSLCDMIVCWEHDWPDCPLDIIELRSVIDKMEG